MRILRALVVVMLLGSAGMLACGTAPQGQRLRIVNQSNAPITNLSVLFPEQEIVYGDVAAKATTEYRVAPKGVYAYAAYRYDVNGETVTQPVIDWVGETPIEGSAITYTIEYDPARPPMQRIQLVSVTRDS